MAMNKKPESGDLKKKVSDAAKVMKTSTVHHKSVNDIADEIIKRGRTDKKAAHQDVDKVPAHLLKKENAKRNMAKKNLIKEEEEIHDDEEADLEGDHVEPDGDELENGDEPTDVGTDTDAETTEDDIDPAEFDVESDIDDYEAPEGNDSNDIDDIISNLLATENIEIDVDAEKGTVKVSDKAKGDDKGVEKVKGDIELLGDEEEVAEDGIGEESVSDEELDGEFDLDLKEAQGEEEVVKNQLDEMLASFGKTYPKIFNEAFINKLGLMVEMYTNAKAKVKATDKIAKVVKSVDIYMEKVEKKFLADNKKKLQEAVDSKKKEVLLAQVKKLLESKMGKVEETSGNQKKIETALKMLYRENKEIAATNKKLRESVFILKTNMMFESATKGFTPEEKNSISKILEGFDFTNSKEFKAKLASAVEIIKGMQKKTKNLKENFEKKSKFMTKQKPVRRTDRTLTVESIKKAIAARKQERSTLNENKSKSYEDEINFDEMEKHIY